MLNIDFEKFNGQKLKFIKKKKKSQQSYLTWQTTHFVCKKIWMKIMKLEILEQTAGHDVTKKSVQNISLCSLLIYSQMFSTT